ncbi:MAG: ABC transporter ATP-binding protein [Chloroflexi bacterium]|nr:ABC transporter ATP-binding protein [Chloroflexota bacterium]
MSARLLTAENISFGYATDLVLRAVTLTLRGGDRVALIGPNGSGKTTLLRILCGILAPRAGSVAWESRDVRAFSRREIAQRIALVPQEMNLPYAFTAHEVVALGRTPHARALAGESRADRDAITRALELTEMQTLAPRIFNELSGGERQRVALALALAQEPALLLLDEPTVHLDIKHQIEMLELVRALNRERGLTVLAAMHDLNLAALYFDQIILLNAGEIVARGAPRDALTVETIRAIFGAAVAIEPHPTAPQAPHVILLPRA